MTTISTLTPFQWQVNCDENNNPPSLVDENFITVDILYQTNTYETKVYRFPCGQGIQGEQLSDLILK